MIICSQCGNTVSSSQGFCLECGAEVAQFAGKGNPAPVLPTMPYASVAEPHAPPIRPQAKQSGTPMIWIVVPLGALLLLIVVVIRVNLSVSKDNRPSNTISTTSPSPSYYPSARIVICRFNGVNVRDAPSLTATVITEIQQGHIINVLRESPNFDTVMIRSRNQDVTDNWSEVQLDNTPIGSVRGWIFSGFLR